MAFDEESGAYLDCRVTRGFPLGGIGSGGLSFNTDGSFAELRLNNNWMCPVRGLRGAFHALFVARGGARETIILRRAPGADEGPAEYDGARNVRSTRFVGRLPGFELDYRDDLPIAVRLAGLTPHVPQDVRNSTLPAALFRFVLENPLDEPVEAAVLFSFENALGRGGTGHLGVDLGPQGEMRGVRDRVVYDSIAGNFQEEVAIGPRRGVRFRTAQRYPAGSHRASVVGEYLLLVEAAPGVEVTVCDGWNADAARASVLDDFTLAGRIRSAESGRRGEDGVYRPAAAVAARARLAARSSRELVFVLAWWTPEHTTEPALATLVPGGAVAPFADSALPAIANPTRPASAVEPATRVGHVYERWFPSVDAVAAHVLDEHELLATESAELGRILADSSLPRWLVRCIENSIDSVLCNTVVPRSGRMYTLEGMDWHWPMGGLTGTNDQRLSAHPYTAVFFTELDLAELDEFRRLAGASGAIPHGNGNCDLALGSTDVPYGWPMVIQGLLAAKQWTDLSMSLVLQVGKLWRMTGRRDILERFWPALRRSADYLARIAPRGVPEGGTTYDIWDFPGAFIYSATLYLATLRTLIDLAEFAEPERIPIFTERFAVCRSRVEHELWDERGYYRTSDSTDSIFTAALAGDWAARYAGLEPVVDPGRAARHLEHQHRALVRMPIERAAGRYRQFPLAEAKLDGTPIRHPLGQGMPPGEEMTYVWQVISYQACEQLYLGQTDAGLETLRAIYDPIWHQGNAWSAGLRGNGESVYMTHPVAWAILNALTGAALDVPRATLHLSPRLLPHDAGTDRLRCPFFFPGFWAMLDVGRDRRARIEVLRSFGAPVRIERIVERSPDGRERTIEVPPVELAAGTRLEVALDRA